MPRNPHATNLRHHRQQVVPDKREAALTRALQQAAWETLARWKREDEGFGGHLPARCHLPSSSNQNATEALVTNRANFRGVAPCSS